MALPARMNLTWCKAQCQRVLRVKLLPVLPRTRRSSTCSRLRAASFDTLHAAILAAIPNGPQKTAGMVWGEFVANQILAVRASDGWNAIVPPPGGSGPGVWIPTPPAYLPYALPQWGFVAPFAMSSSSQFRPPGPPSLDSQRYTADYKEVKELGAAVGSTRTEEQTQIALFWADGAGTETLPVTGTVLRKLSLPLEATHSKKTRGCLPC